MSGRRITLKTMENDEGIYPVYSAQTLNDGVIGKISTYDYDGEYLTWTIEGNAGVVFYRNGKFTITDVCGLIDIKDKNIIDPKFLYFWLKLVSKKYVKKGTIGNLLRWNVVEKIAIPLIPIKKQRDIARKLSKLEELTSSMESGLPHLISLEEKRYLYYREKLLKF